MPIERTYTAWQVAIRLLCRPLYAVLIAADCEYPGTNWTDQFTLERDDRLKVFRVKALVT